MLQAEMVLSLKVVSVVRMSLGVKMTLETLVVVLERTVKVGT